MKKRAIILGAVLALLATSLVLGMQHPGMACELLPVLDGRRLGEHDLERQVYVDPSLSTSVDRELQELIADAAARIAGRYGAPQSRPRILAVADADSAAKWGANATASLHRTPWRSCIVIGPNGRNVDVIAHEWLHAEIQHRVGFWRFLREIPTWFDEGAALTVDDRAPFRPENIELPDEAVRAVRTLDRGPAFFQGDVRTHYQAARLAVAPLIQYETFFDDLAKIDQGQPFESVFSLERGLARHPVEASTIDATESR